MLDFAEFVAINKFDRKGAADALRDVAKQVQRNREAFKVSPDQMPVFGTMASRFNDDGVTALYQALKPRLAALGLKLRDGALAAGGTRATARTRCRSCRARGRVTWPTSPTACAATNATRLAQAGWRARSSSCKATRGDAADRQARAPPRGRSRGRPGNDARSPARRPRQEAAGDVAGDAEGLRRRRIRGEDPRQGNPHRADPHHAVGQQDAQGGACRSTRTTARS